MDSKDNEITNNFSNKSKRLYPITFQWEGKAEKVYLTGSFCDWIKFYEMEKEENKFFFTLFLQKGIYQYKFKIDSNWKFNSNFPTCSDKNGNINNYINVTDKKMEEITTDLSTSSISNNVDNNNSYDDSLYDFSNIFKKDKDKKNKEDIYNNNSCNISQDGLFFEEKEDIKNNFNCSYKKLLPIKNEFIEHLNIKKKINKNKNIKYMVTSCSVRLGFKIATFVYYKPK